MTEQEENLAIYQVLATLLKTLSYTSLLAIFEGANIPANHNGRVLDRFKHEGLVDVILAKGGRDAYLLKLSPHGVEVARTGYLNWQQQRQQHAQSEDKRAQLNTWGTFGSFIIAVLALGFAIYTYFTAASDTKQLEKQVQNQEMRLRALEHR